MLGGHHYLANEQSESSNQFLVISRQDFTTRIVEGSLLGNTGYVVVDIEPPTLHV